MNENEGTLGKATKLKFSPLIYFLLQHQLNSTTPPPQKKKKKKKKHTYTYQQT